MPKALSSNTPEESRKFGHDIVGEVAWGTHLCQFYESKQDLIEILVPYFVEGLRSNEFCMWITSPPLEVEEAKQALAKAVPSIDAYFRKGQLEVISYDDWYLQGGNFDSDQVLKGWVKKEEQALKSGFEGLRLTGNTFWVEHSLWQSFVDYEEAVNSVIREHKMLALCTYCLSKCSGMDVIDVVRNHVGTLVKQGQKWVLVEDVLQRRKAEDAIRKSEQRWITTVSSIGDGVITTNLAGNITFLNSVAEELTGWKFTEVLNKPLKEVFNIINEHSRKEVENPVSRVLKEGTVVGLANHTLLIKKDGKEVPIDDSGAPIKDKDGCVTGVVLVFRDISERKRMEEELISLAKFPSENPYAVFRVDKNGFILYANPESQKFPHPIKLETGKLIHESWLPYITKALSANCRLDFEETAEGRYFLFKVAPIVSEEYVNFYGTEITERKKAEQELVKTKKDWEQTFNNVPDLIALLDNHHKIIRVNQAMASRLGTTPEKCIGLSCFKCVHGTNRPPTFCPHNQTLKDGLQHVAEVHEDALGGDFIVSTTPLTNDRGKMIGSVHVARDITIRKKAEDALKQRTKQLEETQKKLEENAAMLEKYANQMEELAKARLEQLKAAERLAAIGATAGMVGHDIRNPLQSIIGDLYLVRTELDDLADCTQKESIIESVEAIEQSVDYVNKIVQDLQDYAKPIKLAKEETNIEELLNLIISKYNFPSSIKVKTNVQKEASTIITDPDLLRRIISNLVSNSVQAMPNGGKLEISAYVDKASIAISVHDTGNGIPQDVKNKIFTPLFTTKSKGQGFGLAVVKRMTEALGGTVTFESETGKGTKFIVRFPFKRNKQ